MSAVNATDFIYGVVMTHVFSDGQEWLDIKQLVSGHWSIRTKKVFFFFNWSRHKTTNHAITYWNSFVWIGSMLDEYFDEMHNTKTPIRISKYYNFGGHFSAGICPCLWWGEKRQKRMSQPMWQKCQVMTDDKHIFLFIVFALLQLVGRFNVNDFVRIFRFVICKSKPMDAFCAYVFLATILLPTHTHTHKHIHLLCVTLHVCCFYIVGFFVPSDRRTIAIWTDSVTKSIQICMRLSIRNGRFSSVARRI